MGVFDSLKQQLKSDKEENIQYYSIFNSNTIQYKNILLMVNSIDSLNESDIKNIIVKQHQMILNYDLFLKSPDSRKYAQVLFTNKRFLNIFLQVVGLISLNREEIICVNKLAYDYYVTSDKDPEISSLLMQISYQINNILTIKLSAILGINGAKILSIIANSSFKEEKNIHRVNNFIIKCNMRLTVQDIVNIYCILYERFTNPFIYTMLEIKPANLAPDQLQRFDAISLALLSILDSLPSKDIISVLTNYAFTLKLININNIRFKLKTALGYPRIIDCIKEVELSSDFENLLIP